MLAELIARQVLRELEKENKSESGGVEGRDITSAKAGRRRSRRNSDAKRGPGRKSGSDRKGSTARP